MFFSKNNLLVKNKLLYNYSVRNITFGKFSDWKQAFGAQITEYRLKCRIEKIPIPCPITDAYKLLSPVCTADMS